MSDVSSPAVSESSTGPSRRTRAQRFLQRQLAELHQGGVRTVLRKGLSLLELLLAAPVVAMARLLRPLVTVRFGELPADGFGTLAQVMEVYCCERDAGLHGRRIVEFFYCPPEISNRQLVAMWKRRVPVCRFARAAARINNWFPGGSPHRMPWRRIQARDIHNLLADTPAHLSFTPSEVRQGQDALRAGGVGHDTPLVCFHARDPRYYVTRAKYQNHYHGHRNSDIDTQLPAMEALVRRGYVAVRMGVTVEKPLRASSPRILDYATTARTDLLDVYLLAHCRFYLGDADGVASVPTVFRRPVAFVNYIPLEYVWSWNPWDLTIFKTLWLRSERRLLSVREIIESGIGRFMRAELYEARGIEVVTNTPEDITALAIEMDERLNGTWQTTEDDEELQRRFWALIRSSPQHADIHGVIRSRVGAEWLRRHRELLEGRTAPAPLVATV